MNLFEQICLPENLFTAWQRFSIGKHSKIDVMNFEYRLEDNLFVLREQLLSCHYRHDLYKSFTVYDPKRRQIHKATVKDRIVHQSIVNVIEPFFESRFIHDSFSCRIGKGTHAAVDRLRTFLRQVSHNNTRTVYALKCDVKKFFASVNHETLLSLLTRQINDPKTIELLENIIGSFSVNDRRGIPLGNLTSQLFANIYLNELDRYVKFVLREKCYLRYCDDFIVLSESREHLSDVTKSIEDFLDQTLFLQLHPKKVFIRTWAQGIDFLGLVLFPYATAIRINTAKRILQRANEDNLYSYLGVCSHADAYELEQIVITKCISLNVV